VIFSTNGVIEVLNIDDNSKRFGDLRVYELADHYDTPRPFNFESFFNATEGKHPRPIIKILSEDFNLLSRLPFFYRQINMLSKYYKPKNVMILIGDDFSFRYYGKEMETWYPIVRALNSNNKGMFKGSSFRMTTGGDYFNELEKENPKITTLPIEDYFPLIDEHFNLNPIAWTGYFSTRPYLKRRMKRFGQLVRSTGDTLGSLILSQKLPATNLTGYISSMNWPKWLVGVNTHHDAITGTCEREVCEDFLRRIDTGIKNLSIILNDRIIRPLFKTEGKLIEDYIMLGGKLKPHTSTYIDSTHYAVINTHTSDAMKYVRVVTDDGVVANIDRPTGSMAADACLCDHVVGCEHLFLSSTERKSIDKFTIQLKREHRPKGEYLTPTQSINLDINGASLKLKMFNDKLILEESPSAEADTVKGTQLAFSWMTYTFSKEWCSMTKHAAGSYAFSTCNSEAKPVDITSALVFSSSTSITITITFRDSKLAAHIVYSSDLPNRFSVRSNIGTYHTAVKEIDYILRVASNIDSGRPFKTDSNGLADIDRIYGHPRYGDSAEYNYYPVTTHISVQDSKARMTMFVDRATGGTAKSGAAEIMLQRVNKELDKLGLTSKLIEPYPVSIVTEILIDPLNYKSGKPSKSKQLQVELESQPIYIRLPSNNPALTKISTTLGENLPPAVRLSIDILDSSSIFARLVNFGEGLAQIDLKAILLNNTQSLVRRLIDGSSISDRDSDYRGIHASGDSTRDSRISYTFDLAELEMTAVSVAVA
jgi:Glycosyl hydrolases family 38 C-terminal domain/Alpha mannosidase middle domain